MHRPSLARLLAQLALMAAMLSACADVAVVDPGHRAVVLTPDGQYLTLDEGVASIPANSQVDDFNLRQQAAGGTFTAVTADGVPLTVGDPVVSYTVDPDQLVDLDRRLGAERGCHLIARR